MSRKSPRLSTNFFFNILYRISGIIIPLITTPYVSRVLGAENTGIYSYTYTVAWYFVILGCFGFENYGNRQIAMIKDDPSELNKTFTSLFGLQVITSAVAMVGYIVYMTIFCKDYIVYAWISGLYVISAFFNISWLFYGLELFKKTAIRTIFARSSGLVMILCFVKTNNDLWKYVLILAAMELVNQLMLWLQFGKYVSFVHVAFRDIFSHFKGCAILFAPVILINIYRMMDKLMLGNMSTMAEVGFYTYADKITEMPFHIITAVGTVMLPRTTHLVAKGKVKESRKYIKITMKYNTLFACAIAFGMMAVSNDFSVLFFGEEYLRCGQLICIIAPILIVRAWANVCRTQFLMPNHRDKEYIISLVIGVILNLVLNAWSIPKYGAAGAALATLVAEISVAVTQIAFTTKDLPIKQYLFPNVPFIAFGGLMWAVLRLVSDGMHNSWTGLFTQIAIGGIIYIILSFIYLIATRDSVMCKYLRLKK